MKSGSEARMRTTSELLDEALALPVEERASLVDSVLRSLNPGADLIDRAWSDEAARRLHEVRAGKVALVDGPSVLAEARKLVHR